MLAPKKEKRRKVFRRRDAHKGMATSNAQLAFGAYGLKIVRGCEVSSRQIEAGRKAITRSIKRGGKVWIRVFPHKPVTKKGAEVPMGSGKGSPELHVAEVRAGTVIFELDGVPVELARRSLELAGAKLPVPTKFVTYHH